MQVSWCGRLLLHISAQTCNYSEASFSHTETPNLTFAAQRTWPLEVAETQINRLKGNWQEALPEDLRSLGTHKLSQYQVHVSGLAEVRLTVLALGLQEASLAFWSFLAALST